MKLNVIFNNELYSMIEKVTKYGVFWGESCCADEDLDVASPFFGGDIAETKAERQMMRKKLRQRKARIEGMKELYRGLQHREKSIPSYKISDEDKIAIEKHIAGAEKQLRQEQYYLKRQQEVFNTGIEKALEAKRKFRAKHEKESE